ncbi:unnamed protein product [Acanthoscelides obtectus]|uniref:PiggyBac transposable element-derived protein domain-containing protein n=1 Tax=Acanthoscelides obtectus TaxID=200917 RepID=A0A9P0MGX7_ACAOB|nr:unnamed protein product [Acanthoscelides obtectus]CAK1652194.1 hypothetical protein AOBTE_LOCUS17728 [Acanthoscelides obtectus]
MMLSSVDCTRRCLKWYKKLFFHSIDITLLNAHAIFSTRHTKKTSFANFHLAVIAQLIESKIYTLRFGQCQASE